MLLHIGCRVGVYELGIESGTGRWLIRAQPFSLCRGWFQSVRAGKGDDADVIVPAKVLSNLGDGFSGQVADGLSAFESKKLPVFVTRFNNAIGNQRELLVGVQ